MSARLGADGVSVDAEDAPEITAAAERLMELLKEDGDRHFGADRTPWERTMNALTSAAQLLVLDFGQGVAVDMSDVAAAYGGAVATFFIRSGTPLSPEAIQGLASAFASGAMMCANTPVHDARKETMQ